MTIRFPLQAEAKYASNDICKMILHSVGRKERHSASNRQHEWHSYLAGSEVFSINPNSLTVHPRPTYISIFYMALEELRTCSVQYEHIISFFSVFIEKLQLKYGHSRRW